MTDTAASQELQQLKADIVELKAELYELVYVKQDGQVVATTATTTDTAESTSQEVEQLKAEIVEMNTENERLKAKLVELKFKLKAVLDQHVASEAARDEVTQKLKQEIAQLRAEVTAVPDDIP